MSIFVCHVASKGDRIKALIKKAKGRESDLVIMMLAAFVERWPTVPVQLRYVVIGDNTYEVFLEPADPPPDLTDASADLPEPPLMLSIVPDKDTISQLANQFRQNSWPSDPRTVALRVIFWGNLCSVNFAHRRSHFTHADLQLWASPP